MPPQIDHPMQAMSMKHAPFVVGLILALGVGVFIGTGIVHSNSDYVCSAAVNDTQQGSCTNGSWSSWTTVNGVQQRTYTGTQSTVTFSGSVKNVSCSHPSYSASQATGQTTTVYSACQIVEAETGPTTAGGNSNPLGAVTSFTTTVTTGAVVATSSATFGSFAAYQNTAEAQLATTTLTIVPSFVHPGDTTHVYWTTDHVKTCTVSAPNGDMWNTLQSPIGGASTRPITGATLYTLTCFTASGTKLTQNATVNIAPVFKEI